MPAARSRLPQSVAPHIDRYRDALAAIAVGDGDITDATEAADLALRAAVSEAPEVPRGWTDFADNFRGIVATRLTQTRKLSGWTQEQLAEAIAPYTDPPWTRSTVADVEYKRRAVSLEELVILAALYAVPAVSFLLTLDRTFLDLPTGDVAREDLWELLLGHDGHLGEGGPNWAAAARLASKPVPRPAPDYWGNTRDADGLTQPTASPSSQHPHGKAR